MNNKPTHQAIGDHPTKPHPWEQAAKYVAAKQLEEPLLNWLRDSGLPGVGGVANDGSWPIGDRVRFLKVLCGEQD